MPAGGEHLTMMLRAAGRCGRAAAPSVLSQRRYEQATRIVKPRASEGMLTMDSLAYFESVKNLAAEGEEVNAGVAGVIGQTEAEANLDVPVVTQPPVRPAKESDRSASPQELQDAIKIAQMIRAYSVRGHFICDLDPLGLLKHGVRREGNVPEELDPAYFGFTEADYDREFRVQMHSEIGGIFAKGGTMTLRDLLKRLKEVYCGRIGWEFMHMPARDETCWLRDRLEMPEKDDITPPTSKRKQIYKDLLEGELFENFLQVKYPTKRFGLDGGESLIPGMKAIIERAANQCGVKDVVIGMPHRGRLNVLTNVCGKPLEKILCEFEEKLPDDSFGSGDVKYHLGTVNDITTTAGKQVRVSLVANPSHLEAVNPVVAGKARAKQRYANDKQGNETVPIMLHGDAAFSGQGIVYETLGLDNLYRYSCGGTIHIVVNNQIGFTTNPQENRSSPYCTDIGKGGNPVFHVNGDDVESVVRVCEMALDYRQRYKNDVIIDLVCYRRHGHNEKDEPMFTQPLMYKAIKGHPSVLTKYEKQLLNEKVITQADATAQRKAVDARYKEDYKKAREADNDTDMNEWVESRWDQYRTSSQIAALRQTGVCADKLKDIGKKLYTLPPTFAPHPSLKRVIARNEKNVVSGENIEWGTAEALAFATLLLEGNHVRLSGQDVERGTFSHRHAVIHDYNTNELHCALGKLHPEQAHFEVCNSSLSEYGVLGFEVGYSMENPASLVLWEAQFGDFANGAQVIFDQFLSSGEDKWVRQCGLCVLLPHGYDGQGPEHSSARLERFLIMSDEDESGPNFADVPNMSREERQILTSNWQVVYPTTPAQYFHVLRRQVHRNFRKPLIVFVSKAYLRAPNVSSLADFDENNSFQWVIDDVSETLVDKSEVKRVALCSGQVYFKAAEERKKRGINDLALVRVEQLAPFPFNDLEDIMKEYPNAGAVWLQEEPKNMGAWTHVRPRYRTVANSIARDPKIKYIGREPNASPATGHMGIHQAEHEKMMNELFDY